MRQLTTCLVVHVIIIKRILKRPASTGNSNWRDRGLRLEAEDILRCLWARLLSQLISESFEREATAFLTSRSAPYVSVFLSRSSTL